MIWTWPKSADLKAGLMHILLTGAAGLFASCVAKLLLEQGRTVAGMDGICSAYDVRIKEYRLSQLRERLGFGFRRADIAERSSIQDTLNTGYLLNNRLLRFGSMGSM